MSNAETTPLLQEESATGTAEERVNQQPWWIRHVFNAQTLSGLSIIWCICIYITGYLFSVYVSSRGWYSRLPPELDIQLAIAAQLWFWTAFASFLNYARLRRSGIDLPWWFNIIVDVIVFFTGFFISLLYFVLVSTLPYYDCGRYGRPDPDCRPSEIYQRTLGTVVMICVLLLSSTHGALLIIRLRRVPALPPVPNVMRNPSSWREGGWFVGIGRGPLYVRSEPDSETTGERTFDQSA